MVPRLNRGAAHFCGVAQLPSVGYPTICFTVQWLQDGKALGIPLRTWWQRRYWLCNTTAIDVAMTVGL